MNMNYLIARLVVIVSLLTTISLTAQTSRTTADILSDPTITLRDAEQEIRDRRDEIARIDTLRRKVQKAISIGHFIQKLDSLAWIEFPVVLRDTFGSVPVAIVFDHLRLYPDYAQLEVVVGMELPQRLVTNPNDANVDLNEGTGQTGTNLGGSLGSDSQEYIELYFGSPNLKFCHDGGIPDNQVTTIGMYSDVPIGTMNPDKFAMILRGWHELNGQQEGVDLGTFVKLDCDGIVEFGIEADILFSRNWMLPTNAQGDTLPRTRNLYGSRVGGHIQTIVTNWNNILVDVSLPNFALTSYPDIAFSLNNAVFDFSDYRNSPATNFPQIYFDQGLLPPGNPNLWRGVYVESLEVMLPRELDKDVAGNEPGGNSPSTGQIMLDDYGERSYVNGSVEFPDFTKDYLNQDGPSTGNPRAGPSSPDIPYPIDIATKGLSPAPAVAPQNDTSSLSFAYTTETEEALPVARQRTRLGVKDLLIDDIGVSGLFYGVDVIPMGDAKVDAKWDFSVTTLALELVASKVVGFGFGGEMAIPINKKGKEFSYVATANIPTRTYELLVTAREDMDFPIFKLAQVGIDSSSYINIISTPEKRFRGTAVLNGYAAVKGKAGEGIPGEYGDNSGEEARTLAFNAPRLEFKQLALSTHGPAIDILPGGELKFIGQPSILGFPLPIRNPIFQRLSDDRAMITVDFHINLMNENDNGFAAGCTVGIKGKLDQVDGSRRWRSDGLTVSQIEVEIALPKIYIYGYANIFQDDDEFGRGFQGSLEVDIGPRESPTLEIDMNAIFGKTDFRYWYVDGMVQIGGDTPLDIPIIPGVVHINGFGGGAYYHMKMVPGVALEPGHDLGELPSGVKYLPHEPTTLGLKASVPLTSPAETLDGVATLDLRFEGTTLVELSFYGRAEIVSPKLDQFAGGFADKWQDRISDLNKEASEQKQSDVNATNNPVNSILASVYINFNFDNGLVFKGVARAKINAAEGRIYGDGGIDILADTYRNKYHIYVGGYIDNSIIAGDGEVLPPVSVGINLGPGITARAGAYFLTGNDIPGPPPLHPMAQGVCDGPSPNPGANRNGNENRFAGGTGFAFGAFIEAYIDIQNIKGNSRKWVKGEVGAGFDVSILKYARDTRCYYVNKSPHGLKGWRATGNLWIVANLRYRAGRFTSAKNATFKLVVRADVPNPAYLSLQLKIKFLGISFCVNPKIGDECGPPLQL